VISDYVTEECIIIIIIIIIVHHPASFSSLKKDVVILCVYVCSIEILINLTDFTEKCNMHLMPSVVTPH
jgi:hypothetical protein